MPSTYTIKEGDTLSSIVEGHGITVQDLIEWNNWVLVRPGQVLKVTEPTPEPEPEPDLNGRVPIPVGTVLYDNDPSQPYGGAAVEAAIRLACAHMRIDPLHWVPGYLVIAERESALNHPNWRVNTNDSNATGPIVADGHPAKCSRGVVQCIPPTFAGNHEAGTSNNIYDMEANIAASMNYVMNRYGVARDGHDLQAKVQQADPTRPPKGY